MNESFSVLCVVSSYHFVVGKYYKQSYQLTIVSYHTDEVIPLESKMGNDYDNWYNALETEALFVWLTDTAK